MTQHVAHRASDEIAQLTAKLGLCRGLADRLDDASERCASRAASSARGIGAAHALTEDLLTRSYVYQECAGLIREALR